MIRALRFLLDSALILAVLAVLAVVGSGGTTLTLFGAHLGLNHLENPLLALVLLGVLRMFLTSPETGLEGALRRWAAMRGLPPSSEAAGVATVGRVSLYFAGLGLVAGLVDAFQTLIRHPDVAPGLFSQLCLIGVSAGIDLALAWVAGLVIIGMLLGACRLFGFIPSAYGFGRVAALAALVGAALLLGLVEPEWEEHASGPGLAPLTLVPLLTVPVAVVVFLLIPALWLRVRRGRWGTVLGGLVALAGLAALAVFLPAGPGPSPPGGLPRGQPPLLLVTIASLRADMLEVYGGVSTRTPHLDRLAGEGTLVEEALSPIPLDGPALTTLMTGQGPEFHGIRTERQPFDGPVPTLAQVLRMTGYRTAAFVGNHSLKAEQCGLNRGFDLYDDHLATLEGLPLLLPSRVAQALGLERRWWWSRRVEARPGSQTVTRALDWIDRAGTRAWMAWVHLDEPCAPFAALDRGTLDGIIRSHGGSKGESRRLASIPGIRPALLVPELDTVDDYLAAYRIAVAEADRQVGRLMEGLSRRGLRETTLVVLTADHGETLGEEDRFFQASASLSDASLKIPLLLAGPGVARGRRVPGQISLAEVAPAVAGLLRINAPGDEDQRSIWESTQLHELVSSDRPAPPRGRLGRPVCLEARASRGLRIRGVRWAGLKLVRGMDGSERLLGVEPQGEADLVVAFPTLAVRLERMRAELTTCTLIAADPVEEIGPVSCSRPPPPWPAHGISPPGDPPTGPTPA